MGLRVFVVKELFPFTAGGIGRAIANILNTLSPEDLARTAIVYLSGGLSRKRFQAVYPTVTFLDASAGTYVLTDSRGFRYPAPQTYTDSPLHEESVRAMQALLRLEREAGALDYVEFADWGGAAFASCQEKRLGLAFEKTVLAVRLHTTDSVLAAIENRHTDVHALALYDLERKALADCDLIVGQLPGVVRTMQEFFAFEDADWTPRLVMHASPVILDTPQVATSAIKPGTDTHIVFSSKIQRVKRPEVFVRGCCGFLAANPGYRGDILLLAHSFDTAYQERVEALIPYHFKSRFHFMKDVKDVERGSIIAQSVCIFPSAYESFCLAAYEASLLGALCVLNEANPAFGAESPWLSGRDCEKFDGTAEDLVACLTRIFAEADTQHSLVVPPVDPAPWNAPVIHSPRKTPELPLVSVVVAHYNLGSYLLRTVDSALASTYPNLEIVIVDDASTDSVSQNVVARLAAMDDSRLRVTRSAQNVGLSGARNVGIKASRGEFILPLDADDLIASDFIEIAVNALVQNGAYDVVVPQVAYFADQEDGSIFSREALDHCYVLIGEARASGLHVNRFSTATALMRRSLFDTLAYREEMTSYEDWDLYLRAIAGGRRALVTNHVAFFYRRRHDSMIHSPDGRANQRLAYHDVLRGKTMQIDKMRLPLYAIQGFARDGDSVIGAGASTRELRARLEEYENSEVVFAALAIARQLQKRAPWLLRYGKKFARFMWRLIKRFRS
jgi:glycosyltransferase involved in cell wall biosynthesis